MKCDDLLRLLNDHIDGDIDPSVCEDFEKHIEGCNPCSMVIDSIKNTIRLYKNGTEYEIPITFKKKLHENLRKEWEKSVPDGH